MTTLEDVKRITMDGKQQDVKDGDGKMSFLIS
jgi:hypothetical protein